MNTGPYGIPPPVHPQPSIYENVTALSTSGDLMTHKDAECICLDVRWSVDAANQRITQAMRDEGWIDHPDGMMVAPVVPPQGLQEDHWATTPQHRGGIRK